VRKGIWSLVFVSGVLMVLLSGAGSAEEPGKDWSQEGPSPACTLESRGRNPLFILEPGYRLILEGKEGKDLIQLVITVTNQTRKIGNIECRMVEERETANGELREMSRNYYAFCPRTRAVYYFGEEVDLYRKGKVTGHEGSWLADFAGAKAGLMMPGDPRAGDRYYEEQAPKVAMDRAEVKSLAESLETRAGKFSACLLIEETTPLEPKSREYKTYAPGVGMVRDGDLYLIKYKYVVL